MTMDKAAITVLLVDDQSIILDGIEALLAQAPHLQVVARASNGAEALEKARFHGPGLVLMDINMPGMDGIEATCSVCPKWSWRGKTAMANRLCTTFVLVG
jgi:two-component system, NarL family, nitrate/nitrite response regulator NarL